jgi:hypothetical protein
MSQNDFKTSEIMEPQEASRMKEMNVLGVDSAKRVFHAMGMDETGKIVSRKRLSRHDLMPFMAQLPPVLIGMEACGGAHYWARRFHAHGHEVKLMAPQFVMLSLNSVYERTTKGRWSLADQAGCESPGARGSSAIPPWSTRGPSDLLP